MSHFDIAISFGRNCRPAYHLRRVFGEDACPSGIFDWQVTSPKAVLGYMRAGFVGQFELADLYVDSRGCVRNRRAKTGHPHEFTKPATPDLMVAEYEKARGRHEHLASKTRSILQGHQTVLICLSDPMSGWPLFRLWSAVRLRYPRLRFRLLPGPFDPSPRGGDDWQGNAEIWNRHLAPYAVG